MRTVQCDDRTNDVCIECRRSYGPGQASVSPHATLHPHIASSCETQIQSPSTTLTVRLGDSLELVLLLDGVRVGRSLGGVDKLVGETLGDGLGVVESRLSGLKVSDGLYERVEILTPMVMRETAWLTRRSGETSTA